MSASPKTNLAVIQRATSVELEVFLWWRIIRVPKDPEGGMKMETRSQSSVCRLGSANGRWYTEDCNLQPNRNSETAKVEEDHISGAAG